MAGRGAQASIENVVDFPSHRRSKLNEREWIADLMGHYAGWRDLVNMESAERIELECGLAPAHVSKQRSLRICRADAIVWHSADTLSIVEAKVDPSPTAICGGIGQLIYYKALVEAYWEVEVKSLLLASAYLPPFVLDAIAGVKAPVRFLKMAEDGTLSGLVPDYGKL